MIHLTPPQRVKPVRILPANPAKGAFTVKTRDPWERVSPERIHPKLRKVADNALAILDLEHHGLSFIVTEGARDEARQKVLKAAGASMTLRSKHRPDLNQSGYAEAIDVAAVLDGEVRWDWPLYAKIADAMKRAAAKQGVDLIWGGDWKRLRDGPHFELA